VLSRKFNTPPEAIQRANDLNPPFYIKAQQTLFIPVMPGNGPNVYDVKIGDTLEIIAERCKLPVSMLAQVNNLAETDPLFVPAGSPIQQPDGTTVIVREATLTIPGLVIPLPPFPPPTRYRYPTGPIPIVPYSEPYPQYKDPLMH
jgi:LysM repeat protein